MTYRSWITQTVKHFNLSAEDVELLLVNQAGRIPNPDDEVDVNIAKRALYDEFALLIPMYSSVSEGGYSVSWNWDAIKEWRKGIAQQLGLTNPNTPKVTARNDLW